MRGIKERFKKAISGITGEFDVTFEGLGLETNGLEGRGLCYVRRRI